MTTISPSELAKATDKRIVDTRSPQAYQSAHIPGALSACVYEVAFAGTMQEKIPDRSASIVIYDTSDNSRARDDASRILDELGYTDVTVLAGGFARWAAGDRATEGDGTNPSQRPASGSYELLGQESLWEWRGRNQNSVHVGTIALGTGSCSVNEWDGRIALESLTATIDMNQMTNFDIKEPEYNKGLIGHLKSRDFYWVDKYPTAELQLAAPAILDADVRGRPNAILSLVHTARDRAQNITTPAIISANAERQLILQAHFDYDRTELGADYGSDRYYEDLGMHLVYDLVSVELRLVFKPQA